MTYHRCSYFYAGPVSQPISLTRHDQTRHAKFHQNLHDEPYRLVLDSGSTDPYF